MERLEIPARSYQVLYNSGEKGHSDSVMQRSPRLSEIVLGCAVETVEMDLMALIAGHRRRFRWVSSQCGPGLELLAASCIRSLWI